MLRPVAHPLEASARILRCYVSLLARSVGLPRTGAACSLVLLALPALAPAQTTNGDAGQLATEIHLEIQFPPEGALVSEPAGAFLAGQAFALLRQARQRDVVVVLDTSRSTLRRTGARSPGNGAGATARSNATDPDPSIFAAEVAAARQILRGLDPRNTRAALVTFAGDPPRQSAGFFQNAVPAAAITQEPLTTDHARIERALERVLRRGPVGMTNIAAGIDRARVELVGLPGARSEADPASEKVVIFLTDGQPSLPYDPVREGDNVDTVLRAADRAAQAGIRIHSFLFGTAPLERPFAVVELAARTQGDFTPVRHPSDLGPVLESQVLFETLEELRVRNVSADVAASELVTDAEGAWSALVPLRVGRNRIQVRGRASDGSEAQAQVTVQFAPGRASAVPPPALLPQRNRLIEQRLVELQRDRVAAERERVERKRRELRLAIERTRAHQRAQAKELQLEIEPAAALQGRATP